MKRRWVWIGLASALFGMAAIGLGRRGPSLDVPAFTGGKTETFVVRDRVMGPRQITTHLYDGPWEKTVADFGAAIEVKGFRRVSPDLAVWKRGDEFVNVGGWRTGSSARISQARSIDQNRAATTGEIVTYWIRQRLARW